MGRLERTLWRSGVAGSKTAVPANLYIPKVRIERTTKIATAGSCFAQHVGNALKGRRFRVLDLETLPGELPAEEAKRFGYGIYSARYGNIYTVRQLLQLVQEVNGRFEPASAIWERDGRYFDALRPSVEPDGLATKLLVKQYRQIHLKQIARLFEGADVMVFTLRLIDKKS